LFEAALRAWSERHFAHKCCRELLHLHRDVVARYPGLEPFDAYRKLVAARTGADAAAVDAVLRRATESYASWPTSRALNLRDVIHYLAASEYLTLHEEASWLEQNLKRIVDAVVPHEL
jgi:hypothetical protein